MIRSMTGYGEAERVTDAGPLRLRIKTVNHRFFNASYRMPPGFDRWEAEIERSLRGHIARGHVSLTLAMDRGAGPTAAPLPEVDLDRARRYQELLETLRRELGVDGEVELGMIARFGDLFRAPDPAEASERVELDAVLELVDSVVREVVRTRESEGARLGADLEGRLDRIEEELGRVEERAPARLVRERDRLREQVRELAASETVDEDRLAREIAYLAEKWDIHEEIVRFRAHVEAFREALAAEAPDGVGKRLAFLVQEMHREANTIGSKANDPEISHASVTLRESVERLREQVENVE